MELNCLIPFWEGSLEASGWLKVLFKSHNHAGVSPLNFLFLVVRFHRNPILVGVHARNKKVHALQIHIGRSLIETHTIIGIHIHILAVRSHLHKSGPSPLFNFMLKLFNFLEPLKGFFADGDVFGGPHVQIDFHRINNIFSLHVVGDFGSEFPLLGEQILKEHDDGRLHLLKDIFVDDLFSNLVFGTRVSLQDVYLQILKLVQDLLYLIYHLPALLTEYIRHRIVYFLPIHAALLQGFELLVFNNRFQVLSLAYLFFSEGTSSF